MIGMMFFKSTNQLLWLILKELQKMNAVVSDLDQVIGDYQTELQTNTSVVQSVATLVKALNDKLEAALADAQNKGATEEQLSQLRSFKDTLTANDQALANLVIANTASSGEGTGGSGGDTAETGTNTVQVPDQATGVNRA